MRSNRLQLDHLQYRPRQLIKQSERVIGASGSGHYLRVVALLAGDATEEALAGKGTVAHNDEAGVGDLADALALEGEGLADELQGLVALRKKGARSRNGDGGGTGDWRIHLGIDFRGRR